MPRYIDWVLAALCLFILLWVIRTPSVNTFLVGAQQPDGSIIGGFVPKDIIVLVYKAATVALGALAGIWLDRSLFPYGRPDRIVTDPDDAEPWQIGDALAFSFACLRRGIVVIGFMDAFGRAL